MQINNITALDYGYEGGKLWIKFPGTQFEAVRGMNTAQIVVVTDTGDPVETITGFSHAEGIQYDPQRDAITATFAANIVDPEKEQLRAEVETLRAKLNGLTVENAQFATVRAEALALREDVSALSQTATAKMMPVVQKMEDITAAVVEVLGLTENDTGGGEENA